ncbi:hypothetical protein [Tetragenococcus solitarius]|uniref:Uncharacterized protein n=1 Tax=Tetragenococcus solitarius TaxID=71453 RepID=A0ABP6KJU6_9ENTE|nr:hypothetical protein [Tetragenococcus solitarius]
MYMLDFDTLKRYMDYNNQQYIAPDKAGDRKLEMETFKKTGQQARVVFQQIIKLVEDQFENVKAQKVSSWMNQAQKATPLFFCYFFSEETELYEPTFAIRLFYDSESETVGLSTELSFIERYATKVSPKLQNKVLNVPLKNPVYFAIRGKTPETDAFAGDSIIQNLPQKIEEGEVRKILVKYDIPDIQRYQKLEDLVKQILSGFDYLKPYYDETRNTQIK